MLRINCPFCGLRDEREFTYGGPCAPRRPETAAELGDEEWIDYLTCPHNPVGIVREWWWHSKGCGEWVQIARDTKTHETPATEMKGR